MKARLLTLSVAALAAAALSTPASAATVGVVVGTGSIDGVPTTGCVDDASVAFGGTAVALGDYGPGPFTVGFEGHSSICESIASGQGSGVLSGDVAGNVDYTRTLGVITLSGSVSVQGGPDHALLAVCEVEPTSANPVTTFALECAVTLT